MNHPNREQWMSYLYDELSSSERAELSAHLRACPECTAAVVQWESAGSDLDTWKLPAQPKRRAPARTVFRWAAAAGILMSLGFGLGRLAPSEVDLEAVRAAIEPAMRAELRREFDQSLGELAGRLEAQRAADTRAVSGALERMEARRVADYIALKKDLDTVAVLTDAGLRDAEQQFEDLVEYTRFGVPADPNQ